MANQKYIPPQPPQLDAPLFASTSNEAGRVAAKFAGERYRMILTALSVKPACCFEIAELYHVGDNQISGRFGELEKVHLIERTNQRRAKPSTGCMCDEWQLTLLGRGFINSSSKEDRNGV